MLPPYPPMPTEPGITTHSVSIAATAASTALPPCSKTSRAARAACGCGVATAKRLAFAALDMYKVLAQSIGIDQRLRRAEELTASGAQPPHVQGVSACSSDPPRPC